jgi:4,5-epoxidase
VLLAGDAAHIHSPAGGQGMNTGMMDAHNLAWKLALVADGRAPDALLDTYGQERVPVASGVLEFTDRLVRLLTMRNRAKRAVRDTVIPVVSRVPVVQRCAARKLSQLSVAYPRSPLVQPGGHGRGPKPGDRFPDVEVRSGHGPARLHHLLGSGRHVLVVSGAGVRSTLETAGVGRYAELLDVVGGDLSSGFALVRPDGILAARGSGRDIHRAAGYLRRLCGRSEPEPAASGSPRRDMSGAGTGAPSSSDDPAGVLGGKFRRSGDQVGERGGAAPRVDSRPAVAQAVEDSVYDDLG